MSMSRDRVRFTLTPNVLGKCWQGYSEVCRRAFGQGLQGDCTEGIDIICRPSQFARFLIYRSEAIHCRKIKGCNTFNELKAELFTPECNTALDVSKNRHCD